MAVPVLYLGAKRCHFRSKSKIAPADIPAATQLFTPDWIVRYLIENSLGRLWMLNNPQSGLVASMPYYIPSETPPTDFLHIEKPEDIRICDPSCGSGHMLVYAFDLLYQIYEETGCPPADIPGKILRHNLYGIEIDERAAELAAFALTMKARSRQRTFFKQAEPILPRVCHLHPVNFRDDEIQWYKGQIGHDLFSDSLQTTLRQFAEADNFGSLIRPVITDAKQVRDILKNHDVDGNLLTYDINDRVLDVLEMADYLSPKYHVVVTNPPYMGSKGMNARLGAWLKENYENVKSDLFSAFIVRNTELTMPKGELGFMTPFVWMFISSYEKLRNYLIDKKTVTSLVQLEYSGFDGATVPICAFTLENMIRKGYKGGYIRLSDFRGASNQGPKTLEAIANSDCGWFYRACADDFHKIPGSPVAYWVSERIIQLFLSENIKKKYSSAGRLKTHNDEKYVRFIWEVSNQFRNNKWRELSHGGEFRRWYGNKYRVVLWTSEAIDFYRSKGGLYNQVFSNKYGVTCSKITSSLNSFRIKYKDEEFSSLAPTIVSDNNSIENIYTLLSITNSNTIQKLIWIINPSMTINPGDILSLPLLTKSILSRSKIDNLIYLSKKDWDSYETSWDFQTLHLLNTDISGDTLEATYVKLRVHWQSMTDKMHRLEEENNRIFIEAYGLQDELTPDVPLNEITLTCNPAYRYGGDRTEEELEALLRTDTVKELISYAVGCMLGRYSLDTPGLVLANQGDTLKEYAQRLNERCAWNLSSIDSLDQQALQELLAERCRFLPDDDNIIPILDDEWFPDDIVARFNAFLQVTFGKEHYLENLRFIEEALGKDIRKYFLKDFYKDHVQRYKKRPIYWLFSSPSGSFNALIYMHRYQPHTVSRVLSHYVRDYREKLSEKVKLFAATQTNGENTTAAAQKKDIRYKNTIAELQKWEDDVLYPLSTQRLSIDLDDGVKVNYPKFGTALKKIPGLADKEE
ncbi:MAG: BREX-1 system adenine-specific DNA-methyltransferase PglX [Lachnospiraceae bacterium]|nr:BREX-1 system adenine-specific DNA-methyltransferase PglX [Lachnospiraceae bacterium]